jgi:hypothetical protein
MELGMHVRSPPSIQACLQQFGDLPAEHVPCDQTERDDGQQVDRTGKLNKCRSNSHTPASSQQNFSAKVSHHRVHR